MGQVKNSPAVPEQDYQYIDTHEALEAFVRQAHKADIIALDIEGDSMFHYQEKVCLIQMAANGQTVVIDPLMVKDLTSIKPMLENADIPKVIHGADYDIRSIYRDFGITIANLFDTQLASMYMGWSETSLEAVVARHFGVELDKKYQKKNWSRRPLPDEMVAYAASDVTYLIPLAFHLTRELDQLGRLQWVTEECRLLCGVRPAKNNDGPMFLKFKGAGRLEPGQLAVLEALLQMRNAIARQKDRPLFKVISNAALKKIALAMPTSLNQLKASRVLSDKQYDMYAKAVMEAVRNARRMPKDQLPVYPRQRSPRVPRKVPARVKTLRAWRDAKAEELDLNAALLLNRALIKAIAIENPATTTALAKVDGIHQWQVDAFGDAIIDTLQ
ncbi:MAG: HRDC domain-containing protein [Desulfobacteraceae bacterium]